MSRKTVLELLRGGEGAFLSGEELSRRLGLSRAAVWKAVDALRKDGYVIEARTGLGYRLTAAPDAMSEAEIRSSLGRTDLVGRELRCYDTLDSTNIRAEISSPVAGFDEDAAYEAAASTLERKAPEAISAEPQRRPAKRSPRFASKRKPSLAAKLRGALHTVQKSRAGGWLELCASVAMILVCVCAGWAFLALA